MEESRQSALSGGVLKGMPIHVFISDSSTHFLAKNHANFISQGTPVGQIIQHIFDGDS